jgi:phosphohistidine phosphatase SixA
LNNRRAVLVGGLGLGLGLLAPARGEVPSKAWSEATRAWKKGAWLLVMRHEQTVAGVGDPPGFLLDVCATQRNLSEQGLMRARQLGEMFRQAGVSFSEIRSSQWCRCLDTARAIAAGSVPVLPWPALNSFFEDRSTEPTQTRLLQQQLASLGGAQRWLWVTHQVNITALTGIVPAMGEGLALQWEQSQIRPKFRWQI